MLKVTEVVSSKEKELAGKGTFVSFKLNVEEGSNLHKNVELFQRKDSIPPKVGDEIDGTIEPGQFGPKVKKNARIGGQGAGGFRPRDPRETAAIQRQHSQGVAATIAVAAGWFNELAPHANPQGMQLVLNDLARLTDWVQRDIDRGVNLAMYGSKPEKVKEQVKTGKSDVPDAKPGEFVEPKPNSLEGTPWAV